MNINHHKTESIYKSHIKSALLKRGNSKNVQKYSRRRRGLQEKKRGIYPECEKKQPIINLFEKKKHFTTSEPSSNKYSKERQTTHR